MHRDPRDPGWGWKFFSHEDYLHAVHLEDGIDPVWMAGGAFAAGSRKQVSGCGEKAVDCQHDETDRQYGPNYAETKAVQWQRLLLDAVQPPGPGRGRRRPQSPA